jgi:hypothetical protein
MRVALPRGWASHESLLAATCLFYCWSAPLSLRSCSHISPTSFSRPMWHMVALLGAYGQACPIRDEGSGRQAAIAKYLPSFLQPQVKTKLTIDHDSRYLSFDTESERSYKPPHSPGRSSCFHNGFKQSVIPTPPGVSIPRRP